MKERERGGIIFLCESHLGQGVGGRSGKVAFRIVVQHFLETGASAGGAIQISITFPERKISVRSSRTSRIIVQVFLIFRDGEIVKFTSEKRVCVIKLPPIRRFRFRRRRMRGWRRRFINGDSSPHGRFVGGLSATHVRRALSQGHVADPKQDCQLAKSGCAPH